MRSKYKRKLFQKIPSLFLNLIVLSSMFTLLYILLPRFLSQAPISPIGTIRHYKENSIEDLLVKSNIPFERVKIATDSSYVIFLKDKAEVVMSSKKSIQSQISSLHLILSRLTIEGKKFKKLDLRYARPLIEF